MVVYCVNVWAEASKPTAIKNRVVSFFIALSFCFRFVLQRYNKIFTFSFYQLQKCDTNLQFPIKNTKKNVSMPAARTATARIATHAVASAIGREADAGATADGAASDGEATEV